MKDKASISQTEREAALATLQTAGAADFRFLAFLHDRELDSETVARLAARPMADNFALVLETDRAKEALATIDGGWGLLPGPPGDPAGMDELAVDYANIYLTHRYGAAHTEPPWLDDDHLERQGPMFGVRDWYRKYDLAARNWRERPDDHLALQLAFASHVLEGQTCGEGDETRDGETPAPEPVSRLTDLASFLDGHLLRWIDDFAAAVSAQARTPFYAGLAVLTAAYLNEFRDSLAHWLPFPRPARDDAEDTPKTPSPDDVPYFPGMGPGW